MAGKQKYSYYVGFVAKDGRIRYVTEIERQHKTFWYKAGQRALEFSKADADDMMFGLLVNGYPAMVVKFPEFAYPLNPADNEEESVYWKYKEKGEK